MSFRAMTMSPPTIQNPAPKSQEQDMEVYERGLGLCTHTIALAASRMGTYNFYISIVRHLQLDRETQAVQTTLRQETQVLPFPDHLRVHDMRRIFSTEPTSETDTTGLRARTRFLKALLYFGNSFARNGRSIMCLHILEELVKDLNQFNKRGRDRIRVEHLCKTIASWLDVKTMKNSPVRRLARLAMTFMERALLQNARNQRTHHESAANRLEAAIDSCDEPELISDMKTVANIWGGRLENTNRLRDYLLYRLDTDNSIVDLLREGVTAPQA